MPSNRHIDALLGTAWTWDDDDDDDHEPQAGSAMRECERSPGSSAR